MAGIWALGPGREEEVKEVCTRFHPGKRQSCQKQNSSLPSKYLHAES